MANRFDDRDPVEVLGEEFLDRRRRGEHASVQEYAIAYPELATEICRLFPTMLAMEQFKSRNSRPLASQSISISKDWNSLVTTALYSARSDEAAWEWLSSGTAISLLLKVFPRQALRDSRFATKSL